MKVPTPAQLLARIKALPAGRVLLGRLRDPDAVYLVGGAVRDLLLEREPAELDLVVEGDAVSLARRLGGQVLANDRFGTCKVKLEGHTYDIATARTETYERPGALPDVRGAPLAEDLKRRDFTVNAIATPLWGARAGEVQALPGALRDLQAHTLRVLHNRSFQDDPTRLLRLARYAGRLGFVIEPHTRELARAAVDGGALQTVSGARIGAELRLLAREPDPVPALAALRDLRVDRAIHPRFGVRDAAVLQRALALLPSDGRRDLLALAAAAQGVSGEELSDLLDGLAFSAADRERIVAAATGARPLAAALQGARTAAQIAAAAARAGPEQVALAGAHGGARAAADWLGRLRHVRLEIDGQDLLAAGVPRGPLIGQALRAALDAKLDGRVRGRDQELSEALKAVR